MRKIALVDLDDTLLKTSEFKTEAYFKCLNGYFPLDIIVKTYEQSKENGYFDADKHCALLDDFGALVFGNLVNTKLWLEEWFADNTNLLEKLVFPDAELFLKSLAGLGYEIYILTLGTEWFQKAKIEGAGLLRHVSGYIVTKDPNKTTAILSLWDMTVGDDVLFFDDSRRAIEAAKVSFGENIFAVQVLRRDEDLKKSVLGADAVVRNLNEAMSIVLSRPR